MVPVAALPPATPFTAQEIAVLDAPVTEAVNCCVPDSVTVVELGEIEIDAAGGAPIISGDGPVPPVPDALLAAVAPPPHPDNRRQSDKTARGTATPLQRKSLRIIHYSFKSASGQKPQLIQRFGNTIPSCSYGY
jgi:hypothetical protein